MRKEKQKRTRGEKIKWGLMGVALFVIVAIVTGLCLQVFGTGRAKPSEWFKKSETEQSAFGGGMVLGEAESSAPISISSYAIAEEDYAEHGVSAQAESAYTVTATVAPDDSATNSVIEWSVEWEGGDWFDSQNGIHRSVNDYLTISCGSDAISSHTVTVTCLQCFGQPIILTAKCKYAPELTASIQIDYAPKITSLYRDYYGLLSGLRPNQKKTVSISKFNINTGTQGIPNFSSRYGVLISQYYTLEDEFAVSVNIRNGVQFNQNSAGQYMCAQGDRMSYGTLSVTQSDMKTGYTYGLTLNLNLSYYQGWGDSHASYNSFNSTMFNLMNICYCTPIYNRITSSTSLADRQKYFSKNFDTAQGLVSDIDLCDLCFSFEGQYSNVELWATLHVDQFVDEAA